MRQIQSSGPYVDIVGALDPFDVSKTIRLGVGRGSFQQNIANGLKTVIAQYYGIVQDGLPDAVHAFKGLRRPLMLGNDKRADEGVVVYTWRPDYDYVWVGGRFDGMPQSRIPPPE